MSDLGTMITRIEREVARDGLTAEIRDAIRTSIAYYEDRNFDFNEEDATAQAGTGTLSLSFTSNFLEIDRLEISSSGTDRLMLMPVEFGVIRERTLNASGNGVPSAYAVYQDRIYFDLPMDRVFEVKAWGLKQLTDISASSTTTDTNAWMTTAEELIRCHAKMLVFRDRLRNKPAADEMAAAATIAIRPLEHRYASKISTGRVSKTVF